MPRRPTERRDFGFIRRLPSGRYQASFVGPDLRRHNGPVTFESRDLAVMWLAGEKKKVDAAIADDADWVSPTEQKAKARRVARRETLATYGRRWIGERRSSRGEPLRVLTRKDYEQVLATYVNPTFGRMHVDEITRSDVRQWHAGLADAGFRSRSKAYGLLRAIMNSAVDDELIAISPVHIRGAGGATKRRALEPASPAELGVIAANMPERLRAAVMISAWCALRYGELAELRRKDIDPEQKLIKVRRAVTFPKGGGVVGPTKSEAGVRDVAIPPHVWPIIEEHLENHTLPAPNALLFPGEGRGHMWHSVMGKHFAKARHAAGRDDLRWHDLRHTGAILAAQVGATTAELQARLGHSTSVAAQLYQHAGKDRDRLIAERLSLLVEGNE